MKNTFVGTHLDFIGFSASIVCAIHCAFLPFLISALPFLSLGFLENPWIEYSIILLSLFLALLALSHGFSKHHKKKLPIIIVSLGFLIIAYGLLWGPEELELIITPTGAVIVGIAHYINWLYIRKSKIEFPDCNHPNL
ncbi:MerC domain-containing protein [Algoriphagus sp. NG3]|uniref:MerC domain-containing protein n=1 Tax=Algoriphagus sp. NG3 TaxID=3097546 RepID=UPI002A7F3358|nr:MerC domain-containing protein [Algoriphagus sp. NG3]WPR76746.1 MerC domain-containing protein [Algoriphagus sp. NG3]